MPGTLLPCELLDDLRAVARRIATEASRWDRLGELGSPGLEHPVDATATGVVLGCRLLSAHDLDDLGTGLFLQDIGLLALPRSLADPDEPLAPDQAELARQHPLLGLGFLRDDRIGAGVRAVVRSHHEHWDGSGYPDELIGAETPLVARVAAVANTFCTDGLDAVEAGAGSRFDPAVAEALLELAEPYPSRSSAAPTMVSASISWWR
jgi:HD-GYP domain-containing protein (c-di-GMP phosphodiesterase class II)